MELFLSIFAAVVSIASLFFSFFTYHSDVVRTKHQATLDAFDRLQNQALDKLNTYTKKQVVEISANLRSLEYKELSALMARCEHFAVGVNQGVYDIKTLRKLAKQYFIALYEKLIPLIEKKREINTTEKHYIELEELVKSLRKIK